MPVGRHIDGPPLLGPRWKQFVLDGRVQALSSQVQSDAATDREQN